MRRDLYAILEIAPEADEKEIRAAYRRLARKYHPDTGEGSSAEKFRAVQAAYEVLGDADRRRNYDGELRRAEPARPVPYDRAARSSHIDLRNITGRRAGERIRVPNFADDLEQDPSADILELFARLHFRDFDL